MKRPSATSSTISTAPYPPSTPSHAAAAVTGKKRIAGTEGWILENWSRRRFGNRDGEALRRAVRSCAIGLHDFSLDPPAGTSTARPPQGPRQLPGASEASPPGLAAFRRPGLRSTFPQTAGNRARPVFQKVGEMRECALRGSQGG